MRMVFAGTQVIISQVADAALHGGAAQDQS